MQWMIQEAVLGSLFSRALLGVGPEVLLMDGQLLGDAL